MLSFEKGNPGSLREESRGIEAREEFAVTSTD
jgi:hypothetical protein